MNRTVTAASAIALGILLLAVLGAAASPPHPFRGSWKGTDSDGSTIILKFVEESRTYGQVFEIRARDNHTGDWCSTNGPAEMKGVGLLTEENRLWASLVWWCLPPGEGIYPFPGTNPPLDQDEFVYDPGTESITDKWGTVYYRTR